MTRDEYQDPPVEHITITRSTTRHVDEVLADVEAVLTKASLATRAEFDAILAERGGFAPLIDQVQFTRASLNDQTDATSR